MPSPAQRASPMTHARRMIPEGGAEGKVSGRVQPERAGQGDDKEYRVLSHGESPRLLPLGWPGDPLSSGPPRLLTPSLG